MDGVKDFMTISEQECGIVYRHVIKQANHHFYIAENISSQSHYGAAISHLILGSEEMIKGVTLLLEAKGFKVRKIKGINKLFRQHGARHNLIRDLFSVWLFTRPLVIKWINTNGQYTVLEADESGKITGGFVIEALFKILLGWTKAKNNFHWWVNADNLKQKGFYSDYSNGLQLPSNLTVKDYEEAHRHTLRFRNDAQSFIVWLENSPQLKLEEFRKNFVEAQFPQLIEETIFRKHEEAMKF